MLGVWMEPVTAQLMITLGMEGSTIRCDGGSVHRDDGAGQGVTLARTDRPAGPN